MLTFPDRLRVSESTFTPVNQSVSGGQAISGFQQFLTSPRGRWSAKVTLQIVGEEEILAYNAFLVSLQGSGVECLVTPRDGIRPRTSTAAIQIPWRSTVAWSNGSLWSTGVPWRTAPRADAVMTSAAAQGATALTVSLLTVRTLRPGHYVGLADRIYRVVSAVPTVANPSIVNLAVWPRLRAAAAAGQTVLLAAPVCRMRLKSDDSGALSLKWREPSTPSLDFIESIPVSGT